MAKSWPHGAGIITIPYSWTKHIHESRQIRLTPCDFQEGGRCCRLRTGPSMSVNQDEAMEVATGCSGILILHLNAYESACVCSSSRKCACNPDAHILIPLCMNEYVCVAAASHSAGAPAISRRAAVLASGALTVGWARSAMALSEVEEEEENLGAGGGSDEGPEITSKVYLVFKVAGRTKALENPKWEKIIARDKRASGYTDAEFSQANPKFTCCTSTKVQILTLMRLPGRH